jgi:hypothetical protein
MHENLERADQTMHFTSISSALCKFLRNKTEIKHINLQVFINEFLAINKPHKTCVDILKILTQSLLHLDKWSCAFYLQKQKKLNCPRDKAMRAHPTTTNPSAATADYVSKMLTSRSCQLIFFTDNVSFYNN